MSGRVVAFALAFATFGCSRESATKLAPDPAACSCSCSACPSFPAAIVASAVPLDLPKLGDAAAREMIDVSIDADGKLAIDGKPIVNDTDFVAEVKAKANVDTRAVVQASNDAKHGVVIHVLDLLRQAGVTKIGFAVAKP